MLKKIKEFLKSDYTAPVTEPVKDISKMVLYPIEGLKENLENAFKRSEGFGEFLSSLYGGENYSKSEGKYLREGTNTFGKKLGDPSFLFGLVGAGGGYCLTWPSIASLLTPMVVVPSVTIPLILIAAGVTTVAATAFTAPLVVTGIASVGMFVKGLAIKAVPSFVTGCKKAKAQRLKNIELKTNPSRSFQARSIQNSSEISGMSECLKEVFSLSNDDRQILLKEMLEQSLSTQAPSTSLKPRSPR